MSSSLHGAVEDLVEMGFILKEHKEVVVKRIDNLLEGMVPINEEQTQVFINGIGAAEVVLPRIKFDRLDYGAQKIHEAFLPWSIRHLWSNRWENLSPSCKAVRREMARAAMQAFSASPVEVTEVVRNQEGEIVSVEVMDTGSGERTRLETCRRDYCSNDVGTAYFMGENI